MHQEGDERAHGTRAVTAERSARGEAGTEGDHSDLAGLDLVQRGEGLCGQQVAQLGRRVGAYARAEATLARVRQRLRLKGLGRDRGDGWIMRLARGDDQAAMVGHAR